MDPMSDYYFDPTGKAWLRKDANERRQLFKRTEEMQAACDHRFVSPIIDGVVIAWEQCERCRLKRNK